MVTEKHPLLKRAADIDSMSDYWELVENIVEGHNAIKAAGDKYLPKFPDELTKDYNFRLQLTKFTNIYRDVLEGLATKPFEEEISLVSPDIPEEISEFTEDVDGTGNNLTVFSALTFFNGINDSISWIFVDYPNVEDGEILSVAEAKVRNLKPFWTHVTAKNVLEVRTEVSGSKERLSYIRIFEPTSRSDDVDRIREFTRSPDGVVTWELYKNVPDAKKIEDTYVLEKDGKLTIDEIPFIPFITGRRDGKSFKFFPVMRDAADLQITLYRNESALEFIKTMAGYPMLAANGMKPDKDDKGAVKKLSIGPMSVLYGVPDGSGGHGEWKFIEPNANSMEFLQKSIAQTKQDLRELGRQPLTALSTQLTTVTTSIAAGKARSAVTTWALCLKDALENALRLTSKYQGQLYEAQVNVYTGFDNVSGDGSDLEALNAARDRGDISQETYLMEYKRRKVLSPEFSYSGEVEKLLNEIPSDDRDPNDVID